MDNKENITTEYKVKTLSGKTISGTVSTVQSSIENINTDIKGLQKKTTDIQNGIGNLKTKTKNINKKLEKHEKEISGIKADMGNKVTQYQLDKAVFDLQEKNHELKARISMLEKKLDLVSTIGLLYIIIQTLFILATYVF